MKPSAIQSAVRFSQRNAGLILRIAGAAAVLMAASDMALAAEGSSDFQVLYDRLAGWLTGSLGKALALAFLAVGLAAGIVRGSVIAAVTCLGAALALVTMPSILNSLFTGTI